MRIRHFSRIVNNVPKPAVLGRDMFAGAIAAIVTIAYSVSFSVLIFSDQLAGGIGLGFSALLTGAAVTGLVVGAFTRLIPADAGPDTPAVAVMSVLAVAISSRFSGNDDAAIAHVLIAISLATLLTGLVLYTLGQLKAGIWLRFIPYPVIGGFLAASGWFLLTGGLEVIMQSPVSFKALLSFGFLTKLPQLTAGLLLVAAIYFLRSRLKSYLLLPVTFGGAVVITDLSLAVFGGGGDTMNGWFLTPGETGQIWVPLKALAQIEFDWPLLLSNSVEIAAVCGVTAVALLLDISSLEVAHGKAVELDHELKINGLANVIAAPLGGVVGNLSMAGSLLITQAGAVSRFATLSAAGFCGLAIYLGSTILAMVPTPILGGILVYLGSTILYKALIETASQRSFGDNLLAVAIAIAIVVLGYLNGVVLGIVAACLSFALSYSRISVIKQHLTRANFASNVDRSPDQMRKLAAHGEDIQMLWLRGYIFFGTSNRLFEYAMGKFSDKHAGHKRFLLLDFAQVSGLDSSAALSLRKLKNACNDRAIGLVVSGVPATTRAFLEASGFLPGIDGRLVESFRHRNEALEWCEDKLLARLGIESTQNRQFTKWLGRQLGSQTAAKRTLSYMQRMEFKSGAVLVKQGGPSNSVDIIASGRVVVTYRDKDGVEVNLRHMAGHTIVGEMGFYRRARRTASVIAEEPSVVYRMERSAFDRLNEEEPVSANAFHGFIIRLLADRLEFANREIVALQEPSDDILK